jgi:hypothetical protein
MDTAKTIDLNLNLDKLNLERAKNFFDTYDFETIIGDSDKKYFLGQKEPRVCRFCKKASPEVTFYMEAHVMPQFMGNRNLLSYFECDSCNALFSKYEDSFASFFGITRTFAQIKGQSNKVPKFKDPKTGLEVFLTDTGIQISTIEGKEVVEIDAENKYLTVSTERPGYIPIHIPKTIIKIGLCMLSESDVSDYEYARKFIMQSEKDAQFKDSNLLKIFGYFIPGPPKFPKPFMQLYKRKDNIDRLCPQRQVILYHSNYCFQMTLPFADSDKHLQGKNVDLPIFPLLIDNSHFEEFGEYQKLHLNLTSNEKKSGEEHKVRFSFDDFNRTL